MDGAVTSPDASRSAAGLRWRPLEVPVGGGVLRGGVWGPDDGVPVLAVHGITASHRCWQWLAERRPDLRLVAPDLRGRGASSDLPGPWGLGRHAEDVAAVLSWIGEPARALVGHSMGAFVAALSAARHPAAVSSVILVDGGLPLAAPDGMDVAEAVRVGLGPALSRLSVIFEDREAYRAFWRGHPALAGQAGPELDDYADYDLEPVDGGLRSRVRAEAVAADSTDQFDHELIMDALRRLPDGTRLVTAAAGLLGTPPPLYPAGYRDALLARLPGIELIEMDDVNHYTVVMGPASARLAELLGR